MFSDLLEREFAHSLLGVLDLTELKTLAQVSKRVCNSVQVAADALFASGLQFTEDRIKAERRVEVSDSVWEALQNPRGGFTDSEAGSPVLDVWGNGGNDSE